MSSHPFPSIINKKGGPATTAFLSPGLVDMPKQGPNTYSQDVNSMKIDIPREKEETIHQHSSPAANRKQQIQQKLQQQQQQHDHHPHSHNNTLAHTALVNSVQNLPLQSPASIAPHHDTNSAPPPPRGSSLNNISSWVHHPRQPNSAADSYFPHSFGFAGIAARGHSRQTSGAGLTPSSLIPSRSNKTGNHNMSLSLSGPGQQAQGEFANYAEHAGPPSPSTLTDIILGLHSTLYGGKKTQEEVRERVAAFYDQDAIFESPLLQAKGREQIANQFIMAFTLPGMDVTSELRDVICSDFEFDGTRAGIIDHTISVTLLPALFGSQEYPPHSQHQSQAPPGYGDQFTGMSTPGYTLQSAGITPHPLNSHVHTPAGGFGSMFSRFTSSRPHSPTTSFSTSALWGSSRPHTPGTHAASSHIRPLSSSAHPVRPSTPPSVNGGEDEVENGTSTGSTVQADESSHFISAMEAGGGQVSRPQMPVDAVSPHWTSDGLGRASFRAILWGILHPRAVLKSLCTIQLRVMSRLEFNDAGHIVRHEDSWGLRETIEGSIPFASVVYALERRVVGYLCSFAIGKGFRLSSALTRSITMNDPELQHRQLTSGEEKYGTDANAAARALLLGQHYYQRQEQLNSMARSRASSPSRQRFSGLSGHATPYSHTFSAATGSRSRARSLSGQPGPPIRAQSSENLVMHGSAGYGERERGMSTGGDSLPPDSSARYRDRGIRQKVSSTASAPVGIINNSLEHMWQYPDIVDSSDNKSRAPDRDL